MCRALSDKISVAAADDRTDDFYCFPDWFLLVCHDECVEVCGEYYSTIGLRAKPDILAIDTRNRVLVKYARQMKKTTQFLLFKGFFLAYKRRGV